MQIVINIVISNDINQDDDHNHGSLAAIFSIAFPTPLRCFPRHQKLTTSAWCVSISQTKLNENLINFDCRRYKFDDGKILAQLNYIYRSFSYCGTVKKAKYLVTLQNSDGVDVWYIAYISANIRRFCSINRCCFPINYQIKLV